MDLATLRNVGNIAGWILAALWYCTSASAQISPGPLSRAHQSLDGVTKCSQCHGLGSGALGFKCLECHTEIKRRVDARSGYHARVYATSPTEADCTRCHIEHNGQKFQLIRLDLNDFNHAAQTGFALEGKHREQRCASCHTSKHMSAEGKAEIKLKDPERSFLSLRRECASCHNDPHAGQLGAACVRCHTQDAWKPASGFNHAQTEFPLTGSHKTTACQACHGPKPADPSVRFKGLAFASCQNCHTDPHRGAFQDAKFAGTCETCHTTAGWKNNRPSQKFAHATTAFPLVGKHATAACPQCHKDTDFRRPVAHARCQNCHEDIHKGQFATRVAGSDCASCHNETSFKPTLFTRESHRQSAFPLEGKHASLECAQCHKPGGKESVYISHQTQCADCHADPHRGEFAGAPYTNKCDSCHTQTSFKPTTFSSTRHSATRFLLEGAHTAVACDVCHKLLPPSTAPATQVVSKLVPVAADSTAARQYRFESRTCAACHKDPHTGAPAYRQSCETCHTVERWSKVLTFKHSETKFPLEGPHQKPACVDCHKAATVAPMQTGGAVKAVPSFSPLSSSCHGCHQDTHNGQFRASLPEEDCSSCHTVSQWKLAAFNHDKTRFPLDVAHRNVVCSKCHAESTQADGKLLRKYRGTSVDCIQCHKN